MSGAMPGSRLLRIAERLFDRTTLDGVIVPAIADLQHECLRASTASVANRLIRTRAYWCVIRTMALCAGRDVAIDRDGVGRSLAGRMLILLLILVALATLPGNGWLVTFGTKYGADVAIKAGLLLLLPNLVTVLPIAFYFAVTLHRWKSSLDGLSVGALSAVCVVAMSWLLLIVVPETNQTYRLTLLEALQRDDPSVPRPLHLRKGLTEMTLTELNDLIAYPPSPAQESLARWHRHERFAYAAAAPALGFAGLAIARRRRSRLITIAAALVLLGLYYACFYTGLLPLSNLGGYRPWAANVLLILVGSTLFLVSPRRTLSLETGS